MSNNPNNLLRRAVSVGNLTAVRAALESGAKPNVRMNHRRTPLMMAADRGNLNIVKELLKKGAFIHARDYAGQTALHWAVARNRPNVVRELLAKGAKPSHRTTTGLQNIQSRALNFGRVPGSWPRIWKSSANALVGSLYGLRWLGTANKQQKQHASNLLAALFHGTVLPPNIVRHIAQIGSLKKKKLNEKNAQGNPLPPRTLGRTNWSGWTRPALHYYQPNNKNTRLSPPKLITGMER